MSRHALNAIATHAMLDPEFCAGLLDNGSRRAELIDEYDLSEAETAAALAIEAGNLDDLIFGIEKIINRHSRKPTL